MALRKITYYDDPLLRRKSREVKDITDRIRELIDDMWETMYASDGVGLAAPQVGVLRQIAVIDVTPPPEDEDPDSEAENELHEEGGKKEQNPGQKPEPEIIKYVLINPEIVEVSEEKESSKEGCLSVPGKYGFVERPTHVIVRALDIEGESFEIEAEGMLARALLHELDHLNGVLFTDIAESIESAEAAEEEDSK